jgi:hypothetical protein
MIYFCLIFTMTLNLWGTETLFLHKLFLLFFHLLLLMMFLYCQFLCLDIVLWCFELKVSERCKPIWGYSYLLKSYFYLFIIFLSFAILVVISPKWSLVVLTHLHVPHQITTIARTHTYTFSILFNQSWDCLIVNVSKMQPNINTCIISARLTPSCTGPLSWISWLGATNHTLF